MVTIGRTGLSTNIKNNGLIHFDHIFNSINPTKLEPKNVPFDFG